MSEPEPANTALPRRLLAMARENPEQVRWLGAVVGIFLLIYFMPAGTARFDNAVLEGIRLTHWYAQEHVILCLLPAFVIAGAMATYLSQGAVMRYLGPNAPKPVAFGMASVSGTLLAVCSCTVLPLFGGIYRRGAGLGPAVAFLYSGPAINIMAIVVTAKVLGFELGLARAGAVAAQHAGDPHHHGHTEDPGLLCPGGGHGNLHRLSLRPAVAVIPTHFTRRLP